MGGRFVSRTGRDLTAINDSIDQVDRTRRALVPVPADEIRRGVQLGLARGVAVPDMASYFRLRLRARHSAESVSDQLRGDGVIAAAYPEPLPAPPPVTPSFTALQTYMGAAPTGMGVSPAAARPGITGGNVKVADVEYSWNTAHEDLSHREGHPRGRRPLLQCRGQ